MCFLSFQAWVTSLSIFFLFDTFICQIHFPLYFNKISLGIFITFWGLGDLTQ